MRHPVAATNTCFNRFTNLPITDLPIYQLFQIRTNKDGSKTQVVRQYGCNTSSATEPEQSVTYEKNSFVYINENPGDPEDPGGLTPADLLPVPLSEDTTSIRMRGSHEDHRGNDHDPYGDPRGKHSGS